ncbi:MAG: hypothetical protein M5U28_12080 [Sandaracinaceae bacterium]|nr:hypothetical protein [Sandaracinaceae bacterium]
MTGASSTARSFEGKYRIVEQLGGDGRVERYLAEHTAIRRPVEIHCLAPGETAEGEAAAQLARTARALGGATHRNLQSVVDSGRDGQGRPYVVFEALRGRPLEALLGAPMEPRRGARIVVQILEALRTLHDAGVVLRALSPAEIIVEAVSAGEELVKLRGLEEAALVLEGGAEPRPRDAVHGVPRPGAAARRRGARPARRSLQRGRDPARDPHRLAARRHPRALRHRDPRHRARVRRRSRRALRQRRRVPAGRRAPPPPPPIAPRASRCPRRRIRCRPTCSTSTSGARRATARAARRTRRRGSRCSRCCSPSRRSTGASGPASGPSSASA